MSTMIEDPPRSRARPSRKQDDDDYTDTEDSSARRLTLSFVGLHATLLRSLAARWKTTPAGVARRAMALLAAYADLGSDEDLVVRNRKTGAIERLRFEWEVGKRQVIG